jgi:hypothetical protein
MPAKVRSIHLTDRGDTVEIETSPTSSSCGPRRGVMLAHVVLKHHGVHYEDGRLRIVVPWEHVAEVVGALGVVLLAPDGPDGPDGVEEAPS